MTGKVIVVGAGIAGLSTALRLREAGWEPLVVERSPSLRDSGYAVVFSGIGYDAAERMGILAGLRERAIPATDLVYVKPDGSTRFTIPRDTVRAMQGERSLNILRGDIERVLYEAVRERVEIRFSTTPQAVEQDDDSVKVTLSDGTVVEADLLVGADGLHSATRELVFGREETFRRDLGHMVGVFMMESLPGGVAEDATSSLTVGGRTLAIVHVGDGRCAAFFGYRTDRPDAELADGALTALPRAYADMRWAAPEVLGQLHKVDSVYFDAISQRVVDGWSRGRVVLLGDAAWCVTLFAGFGSSLAVAGADLLGDELERYGTDVRGALSSWEARLRPEAERKQKLGRRVKGLYAPADPVRLWLRDLPLRMAALPPVTRLLERRLQLKG
ncbi:2-polyprenyl-6-methoxyphenol hydroxylase-like FAD-dependent oxidoreductase [Saccharomonospora amisosensis]|uniref:2-polyprenyl-6-methoxyphenol hydroxylase-like FAD-dependent oxidoreductase n=1 Tax=Saccharomonospora amisosensis TaxID=1128677 RepID=A0A7X5UMG8_9PSEU|nr:FAD-dependent oxidoreductase [Saccharomonospora amisosensis]NIJ10387.1 2-polyprenyl-6-methoxyphenol hydroxylase-like FAD-dependent oxidoreductase [Saccharomonospora amisosensis]